ncbi:unnamed protein product [Moneuplotes crassus]|uniref:Uncharacterized protein n=1 Tax=Euplotes crassus TaxID=5936 RepID=A0AAD1XZ31_EUPCR|nr:unnamed protein product [Moneuplotes crassus]
MDATEGFQLYYLGNQKAESDSRVTTSLNKTTKYSYRNEPNSSLIWNERRKTSEEFENRDLERYLSLPKEWRGSYI